MRVVADSHALVWFLQSSPQLSKRAARLLRRAAADNGLYVSVATLLDLSYVAQRKRDPFISAEQLDYLRHLVSTQAHGLVSVPIDAHIVEAFEAVALPDPWDRLIVATAMTLDIPLVTKDAAIGATELVQVAW